MNTAGYLVIGLFALSMAGLVYWILTIDERVEKSVKEFERRIATRS